MPEIVSTVIKCSQVMLGMFTNTILVQGHNLDFLEINCVFSPEAWTCLTSLVVLKGPWTILRKFSFIRSAVLGTLAAVFEEPSVRVSAPRERVRIENCERLKGAEVLDELMRSMTEGWLPTFERLSQDAESDSISEPLHTLRVKNR